MKTGGATTAVAIKASGALDLGAVDGATLDGVAQKRRTCRLDRISACIVVICGLCLL